ncbi:MAG: AbrB/MazE/SpoVT family DNA-binding domain-containing protein [Thermodesulfobacteriota bacterium]|nr:AbrB/MazE/SpoVT family DNA-binding domain-containing protein [Thermodesulfobacteriota bacterium]
MKNNEHSVDIKLVSIGNSRGIRIPKALLQKYDFTSSLMLEETDRGLLLRKKKEVKLSFEDTYKAMATENEDWEDWSVTALDGLEGDDFEH